MCVKISDASDFGAVVDDLSVDMQDKFRHRMFGPWAFVGSDRPLKGRRVEAAYPRDPVRICVVELLNKFTAQNAETLRILDSADLDTAVPVPQDVPWFPKDINNWTVRWVIHHLINELARHAGQADIIRESIDGATLYELVAGIEGWEETEWIKPWKAGV